MREGLGFSTFSRSFNRRRVMRSMGWRLGRSEDVRITFLEKENIWENPRLVSAASGGYLSVN